MTIMNKADKENICKTKLKMVFIPMKDDSYNTDEEEIIPSIILVENHLNNHFIGEAQTIYLN